MTYDPGKILGRGISFPPRVGADGRIEWSVGEANVRESIRIILLTEQRERVRLAEFGGGFVFVALAGERHAAAEVKAREKFVSSG